MEMKSKVVLYLSGGSMQGVFGAGVVSYLEEISFQDQIEAIYAGSAGALNATYFLIGQTTLGSTIYWENLSQNFISVRNFYRGVWDRFRNKFLLAASVDSMRDAVDLDYLFKIITDKKRIDIKKLEQSRTPFYVKVFNLDLRRVEYKDIRKGNAVNILRASVTNTPYVHKVVEIDNHRYVDATIAEPIGYDFLRQKYPENIIVFVYCGFPDRKWRYKLKNFLEGKFMSYMYDDTQLYKIYSNAENRLREDLEKIKKDPNAILIAPTRESKTYTRTTDRNKLQATYRLGIRQARALIY